MKARSLRVSKDDLVDAVRENRVDLEKVAQDELPEELKKMKPGERKSYVEGKSKEREQIRKKILEVSKKRDAFLMAEREKRGGKRDAFADASRNMQQQLRRVLQEGEIRRVGDSSYRNVDVRVICATNRNLPDEVEAGRFMHDLYHRLLQFPVRLPPLRERKEDIPSLVEHFIVSTGSRKNPPVRGIEPEGLELLMRRDWRANNVRQLKNLVELAVDLEPGGRVGVETLERTLEIREETADSVATAAAAAPLERPQVGLRGECLALDPGRTRRLFQQVTDEASKEERPYYRVKLEFSGKLIVEALRYTGWKLRPAARLLGISPVKLRQDFRQYLETLLAASPHQGAEALAEALEMPLPTLRRKLADFGVEVPPLEEKAGGAA